MSCSDFYSWANQICADDYQERGIVLASMKCALSIVFKPGICNIYNPSSMWNNVVNAWWPLLFYPATDAPKFRNGMIAMICVSVATLGITWLVRYLERREWRLQEKIAVVDEKDVTTGMGDESRI